jgi:hypothetical protein
MKYFSLIIVLLLSCSKKDNPEPIAKRPITQTVVTTPQNNTVTPGNNYNFEGTWICDNWLVDDFSGMTRKRVYTLSDQTSTLLKATLAQFDANNITSYNIYQNADVFIDSTYFEDFGNLSSYDFKGVLTSDSTLMVYAVLVPVVGPQDTIQVKEFRR